MGAEWIILGGIAAVSRAAEKSQARKAELAVQVKLGVVKQLRCDNGDEEKARADIKDPETLPAVWDRIERFKRDKPYLCVDRAEWNFVGRRRIELTQASKKYNRVLDEYYYNARETVLGLLCRTFGKLSSARATEVGLSGSHETIWRALPDSCPKHKFNGTSFSIEVLKKSIRSERDGKLVKLAEFVRSRDDEVHNSIVYMTKCEFDPNDSNAADYVLEKLKDDVKINASRYYSRKPSPASVLVGVTTASEYEDYLDNGGTDIPVIRESIQRRLEREQESAEKLGMNYIPEADDLARLIDSILWDQERLRTETPDGFDTAGHLWGAFCASFAEDPILNGIVILLAIYGTLTLLCSR